jgi:hypothetical protein
MGDGDDEFKNDVKLLCDDMLGNDEGVAIDDLGNVDGDKVKARVCILKNEIRC